MNITLTQNPPINSNYLNTRVYQYDKQPQQYYKYNNQKPPMHIFTEDTSSMPFRSVNQPMNTPLPTTHIKHRPNDIPRPTNDKRLFIQPYAPHLDQNQGEYHYRQIPAAWPSAGPYFYSPQYPTPQYNHAVPRPTMFVPPTRKVLTIINPTTGAAITTQKVFEFTKTTPVRFTDPAVRERELQEQKEKEEAQLLEKKRLEQEELERRLEEERESRRVISEIAAEKKVFQKIKDFSTIHYPPGVVKPEQEEKKHVYSIDFLLQFQQLCLDTTVDLSKVPKGNLSFRRPSAEYQPARRRSTDYQTPRRSSMDNQAAKYTRRSSADSQKRKNYTGHSLNSRGNSSPGGTTMKITRNPSSNQVQPLERSDSRWVPSTAKQLAEGEQMSEEFITRKVNALLNKLTMEKFDSISEQTFNYARQSEKETDGRSLRIVLKLTFEKACDEPNFATMWARLCRTMHDSMTDTIRDAASSGKLLFRKCLFNRCQAEFEKGWKAETTEDLMSDEYYKAAKAKRQALGLVQFIGELFKLGMLSERIMYTCMLKLCNDPLNAKDEEAESLCKLLTTIGQALDGKPKTTKWLNVIVSRMKEEMINSPKLTSRVKFMIQDLLDLRKNRWVPRGTSS